MQKNYSAHTKASFDKIADEYDVKDNANEILQWMRTVVQKIYLKHFKADDKILELNCGTGVDAVLLAQNGMNVTATDISPKMVNNAKNRVKSEHLENKIDAFALSFDEISSIEKTRFDGVVSNFGGLNCINDFEKLSSDLYNKLKPGGKFIAVVMNKFCPWEIFYYMLKLDFKNAFRRFNKNGTDAELNGNKVKTFYFFPGEFGNKFKKHFSIEKIYALAYYTPPPYLIGIYNRFKPVVKLFMKLDEIIKCIFPFSRMGDHFIIVLKKIK
jgi:ubiquinone/menaquinone biosynthesis C-methylase UbiE